MIFKDQKFKENVYYPSVFIFSSKGEPLYAGLNQRYEGNDATVLDEVKKELISGLEKNGGIRTSGSGTSTAANEDVDKARELLRKGQLVPAAELASKLVKLVESNSKKPANVDEKITALVKLTGLKVVASGADGQINKLVDDLAAKAQPGIESMVKANANNPTIGAVKLAQLERSFGQLPPLVATFQSAWEELQAKSGNRELKKQAELIDKARELEKKEAWSEAVTAYRAVITSYPNTQPAQLCQLRIQQLEAKVSGTARVWKTKNGKYSITATLVSFDGTTVRLISQEGKVMNVAAQLLSDADQQYLSTNAK